MADEDFLAVIETEVSRDPSNLALRDHWFVSPMSGLRPGRGDMNRGPDASVTICARTGGRES